MRIYAAQRLDELDSLRGLAALSVVLHHYRHLWSSPQIMAVTGIWTRRMMNIFTAGHEAVLLFFLSADMFWHFQRSQQGAALQVFFTRRVFRIYFPYLAALVLSVSGAAALHNPIPLTPWFQGTWFMPSIGRLSGGMWLSSALTNKHSSIRHSGL